MKNKTNIAELLKDCPKGMELDCTMYDDITLVGVDDMENTIFPIRLLRKDGTSVELTKYGQYADADFAKCVIFPKGKTTWEGFVPPCKFKTGDVLFVDCSDDEDRIYQYIFILNDPEFYGKWQSYCHLDGVGCFHSKETYLTDEEYHPRFATEEEKEKLFRAIKANGYKWNPETKTLEKLPKFKVGDRVKKNKDYISGIITDIFDDSFKVTYDGGGCSYVQFHYQDDWELVSNKFDITTLKPFESRVLARSDDKDRWKPAIFGGCARNRYNEIEYFYALGGTCWRNCIPYEGNEHLLGTTNDCDDFYKNW